MAGPRIDSPYIHQVLANKICDFLDYLNSQGIIGFHRIKDETLFHCENSHLFDLHHVPNHLATLLDHQSLCVTYLAFLLHRLVNAPDAWNTHPLRHLLQRFWDCDASMDYIYKTLLFLCKQHNQTITDALVNLTRQAVLVNNLETVDSVQAALLTIQLILIEDQRKKYAATQGIQATQTQIRSSMFNPLPQVSQIPHVPHIMPIQIPGLPHNPFICFVPWPPPPEFIPGR
ncbi:MAG: hypothetical protein M1834_002253 [Cirrosporium novae-zelandiae]|nr:MAG: hypothetical protein M1834_002253 [Cirrosporium novae-zelandiae]